MKNAVLVSVLLAATAGPAAAQQVLYGVGSGVGDGSSNLYRITAYDTAPATFDLGETGLQLSDVAVHPITGKMYALDLQTANTLFEVDPSTAALTIIGPTGTSTWINALEFDAAGTLYGWDNTIGDLTTIDLSTGLATTVGNTGFISAGDLTCDLDGTLWGSDQNGLVRIDPATGAGTLIGPFGVANVYGIEVDLDGRMFGFAGALNSSILDAYTIDRATGAATFVGSATTTGGPGVYGVSFTQTCGFTEYGAGAAPAQTLGFRWRLGAAPNHQDGTLSVLGGTPGGAALLLVGLAPTALAVGPNTVLVDLTPGTFFTTTVPLGPAGIVSFPLSAKLPALAAAPLYAQVVDFVGPATSNGLRMSFCP